MQHRSEVRNSQRRSLGNRNQNLNSKSYGHKEAWTQDRDRDRGVFSSSSRYGAWGDQGRKEERGEYDQEDRYGSQNEGGSRDGGRFEVASGSQNRERGYRPNYEGRDEGASPMGYERYNDDFIARQSSPDQHGQSNRGRHVGKGPKNYMRSDDRIKEDVCEAICQHGDIDASNVEVEVEDGTVTLSGTVEERRMKHLIEDAIEEVSGVKDVANQIRTASAQSSARENESGKQGRSENTRTKAA